MTGPFGTRGEGEITKAVAPPTWLRNLGFSAWLLVGLALAVVGAVWVMSLTHTIVAPLITAAVVAAVASPLVSWLERHRVPRILGTVLLLLGMAVVAALVLLMVLGGIKSQTGDLGAHLSDAKDTAAGWLEDAGVSSGDATEAKDDASSTATSAISALLEGVAKGVSGLSSLVFFLSLTALSLVFLLKDGPQIRAWCERHAGLPLPLAHTIGDRLVGSLRGYFLGVTIVAAFNGVVVGAGAFLIGVPMAGSIAIITFLAAYVPYLGAWTAGVFSVLVALGGAGPEAAGAMIVLQLLANGALQQLVQPIAMGSALGIHPLAVLIVTIAGGSLFGAAGLLLSAPLTSAIVRVSEDMSRGASPATDP